MTQKHPIFVAHLVQWSFRAWNWALAGQRLSFSFCVACMQLEAELRNELRITHGQLNEIRQVLLDSQNARQDDFQVAHCLPKSEKNKCIQGRTVVQWNFLRCSSSSWRYPIVIYAKSCSHVKLHTKRLSSKDTCALCKCCLQCEGCFLTFISLHFVELHCIPSCYLPFHWIHSISSHWSWWQQFAAVSKHHGSHGYSIALIAQSVLSLLILMAWSSILSRHVSAWCASSATAVHCCFHRDLSPCLNSLSHAQVMYAARLHHSHLMLIISTSLAYIARFVWHKWWLARQAYFEHHDGRLMFNCQQSGKTMHGQIWNGDGLLCLSGVEWEVSSGQRCTGCQGRQVTSAAAGLCMPGSEIPKREGRKHHGMHMVNKL